MATTRQRIAPVLDLAAIVLFIVIGRGRHDIHSGISWFLTVLWPIAVGWFAVALLTRLYTRTSGTWTALAITLLAGIAVASVLRGAFTPRPYVSVFTVIAIVFLGLVTFGWRLIATFTLKRRATA